MEGGDDSRRSGQASAARPSQAAAGDNRDAVMASMQAALHRLEAKVADLEGTVMEQSSQIEQLQRWAFSIPPIPHSYWYEQGMSEEFVARIDSFMYEFKKKIFDATRGRHHSIYLSPPDDADLFIDDYFRDFDALLPYWRELARALHSPLLKNCAAETEYSSFDLSGINISDKVMDLLGSGLVASCFKTFRFNNNRFGSAGINFVADTIRLGNPYLETLFIENNLIESEDDVRNLCNAIRCTPSLKRLAVKGCRHGQDPSSLIYPLITASDRLEHIELHENMIISDGNAGLANFLVRNPALKHLDLRGNQFNDNDATLIATALERNNTLEWIDLSRNNITNAGRESFVKRIFDAESLDAVCACNHTCHVELDYIFDGIKVPRINCMYNDDVGKKMNLPRPNTTKKMKLLSLLSAPYEETVNLHFLNDMPIELMPSVLAFVQDYPDVISLFPENGNAWYNWEDMSDLRPELTDSSDEHDEVDDNEHGGEEEQEDAGEDELFHEWWHEDTNEDNYIDGEKEEEVDPRPAQIKRLNMVFEIMRGWKMPTGEPLYLIATINRQ